MVVQTLLQDRLQTVRRKPELRELGFELLHRGHGFKAEMFRAKSFFAVLLGKDFAHDHTTSILSTEASLLEYFEAEKTPGLVSLVVPEAETMERLRGRPYNKSYSFYDTHNILQHS